MNSKKSKKKFKQPLSSPAPVNREEHKDTQEKSEVKVDLSDKEQVSELVPTIPTAGDQLKVEQVEEQFNTPEKPKRKRGKNKKQDRDHSEEIKENIIDEKNKAGDFVTDTSLESQCKEDTDTLITEAVPPIAPATRKKNKKKDQAQHITETISKESPIYSAVNKPIISDVDKIFEPSQLEEIVQDQKSKKKNKKKKRCDSVKNEEIVRTAFEQLTVEDEISSSLDCKPSNEPEKEIQREKETTQVEVKETLRKKYSEEIQTVEKEIFTEHQTEQKLSIDTPIIQNIAQDTEKDLITIKSPEVSQEIQETECTKPKAKIAKPVDKQRKGQKDLFGTNTSIEVIKLDEDVPIVIVEEQLSLEVKDTKSENEPTDTKISEEVKVSVSSTGKRKKKIPKIPLPDFAKSEEIDTEKNITTDISELTISEVLLPDKNKKEQFQDSKISHDNSKCGEPDIVQQDLINIDISQPLNNNVIGTKPRKKGKKYPKLPVTPGVLEGPPSFEICFKNENEETKEEIPCSSFTVVGSSNTSNKCDLNKDDDSIIGSHSRLSKPLSDENIAEPNLLNKSEETCNKEPNITDFPFIDSEVSITEAALDKSIEVSPENVTDVGLNIQADQSNPSNAHPKTELLMSNLDTPPDIHYPRSTSHETDSNNNPFIREIHTDELSTSILKEVPLIQGSGETPIGSPKVISSDISIIEVEIKNDDILHSRIESMTPKTDLKSKMIEVNKDMEGLRLSIERSLAEFTALEETEQQIEKQFEDLYKHSDCNIDADKTIETTYVKQDVNIDVPIKVDLRLDVESEVGESNKPLSSNLQKSLTETVVENKDLESMTDIAATEQHTSENDIKLEKNTIALNTKIENIETVTKQCTETVIPVCPSRKDNKSKNKKKKGRQETVQSNQSSTTGVSSYVSQANTATENKSQSKQQKSDTSQGDQTKKHSSPQTSSKKEHGNIDSIEEKQVNASESKPESTIHTQDNTSMNSENNMSKNFTEATEEIQADYEAIENFEDALTSSTEDAEINKSFEMIVNETNIDNQQKLAANKPEIKIIGPDEKPKETLTPPKNLLGHPDVPVSSNKTDYKKEKNKTPNALFAKVKIKDSVEIETPKELSRDHKESTENSNNDLETYKILSNVDQPGNSDIVQQDQLESTHLDLGFKYIQISKEEYNEKSGTDFKILTNGETKKSVHKEKNKLSRESQTDIRKQKRNTKIKDTFTQLDKNEEFVYKYSFRKVFLPSTCHVCKKVLAQRVACAFCNLLFYCSNKHKDEDWPQHQALCFAISTIGHQKDQRYVYADTKNLSGQNYRLIRMQMILSCEKVLKRRLVPWEQEMLLYPRVCAEVSCRQWKQAKLKDCDGCRQVTYCCDNPEHLPKTHQRWCKSYALYEKLVIHQQTKGRLEPKLPTKVMNQPYVIPEKINEVLASMYEEKIDMNDIQYAALTQLATAPLTAAYAHQIYRGMLQPLSNGISKKSAFTIHVVGAEMQFEADALSKWEVFFLHLRPDLQLLSVVLISSDLNPSNLPLDLLANIKLCENCRSTKRRVTFSFQDKKTYSEYRSSSEYVYPDLICAFNPSIQRSSIYKELDPWPASLEAVLRTKAPFVLTAYSIAELLRDSLRIKECVEHDYKTISEAKYNNFASVRPDRNFITDDEMPLLFKNYCFMIYCGS